MKEGRMADLSVKINFFAERISERLTEDEMDELIDIVNEFESISLTLKKEGWWEGIIIEKKEKEWLRDKYGLD